MRQQSDGSYRSTAGESTLAESIADHVASRMERSMDAKFKFIEGQVQALVFQVQQAEQRWTGSVAHHMEGQLEALGTKMQQTVHRQMEGILPAVRTQVQQAERAWSASVATHMEGQLAVLSAEVQQAERSWQASTSARLEEQLSLMTVRVGQAMQSLSAAADKHLRAQAQAQAQAKSQAHSPDKLIQGHPGLNLVPSPELEALKFLQEAQFLQDEQRSAQVSARSSIGGSSRGRASIRSSTRPSKGCLPMDAAASARTLEYDSLSLALAGNEETQSELSSGDEVDRTGLPRQATEDFFSFLQSDAKEPDRQGIIPDIVTSTPFAFAGLAVIIVNTGCVWWSTDWVAGTLEEPTDLMKGVDKFFLAYYTTEVILRLYVHRHWFFCNADWNWNIFDFTIVFLGLFQEVLEDVFNSKSLNMTFMRACRILRVSKVFRIFRAIRFLSELRLMAACVVGSLGSLFWAILFLQLLLMIASLVFVQSMAMFRLEHGADCSPQDLCDQIPNLFGSVASTMVVLLQCTTGGYDWNDIYSVVKLTGTFNTVLFLGYILFFDFAFFNIVMSIFVDKAMKLARPEEQAMVMERKAEEQRLMKHLRLLMGELDDNQTGSISASELNRANHDEVLRTKFDVLGVSVREIEVFFQTLSGAAKTSELDIDDFVDACVKMKGPASGIDLQAISFQLKDLAHTIEGLQAVEGGKFRPKSPRALCP